MNAIFQLLTVGFLIPRLFKLIFITQIIGLIPYLEDLLTLTVKLEKFLNSSRTIFSHKKRKSMNRTCIYVDIP